MVTIDETKDTFRIEVESCDKYSANLLSMRQIEGNERDWIQVDSNQAAQLIQILQKFIDGEDVG